MAEKNYKVRVIAPYVTLKVFDPNGTPVMRGFYQGAIVENVDPDSVAHMLIDGMVSEVTSDKEIFEATDSPAGAGAPTPLSDLPLADRGGAAKAPAKQAPKPDWEDWAKAKGATDEEIDTSTKAELVKKYGE